jgi:hypothetical protein
VGQGSGGLILGSGNHIGTEAEKYCRSGNFEYLQFGPGCTRTRCTRLVLVLAWGVVGSDRGGKNGER